MEQLKLEFKREEYSQQTQRVKTSTLHFLLLYAPKTALEWISQGKKVSVVDAQTGKTPSMLAACLNQVKHLKLLLNKVPLSFLENKDKEGKRALDHAEKESICYELLLGAHAKKEAPLLCCLSWKEMSEWQQKLASLSLQKTQFFFKEQWVQGSTLSHEQLYEETGRIKEWRDVSYCSPEKTISKEPTKYQHLFKEEGIFPLQWPSIRIAKHPLLKEFGSFANQNIDKFQTVSIYSGAVVTPQVCSKYEDYFDLQNWKDAHSCGDRWAYHQGSHASFFNYGFPNCFLIESNETGVEETYIIAGEAIAEGKELLYGYGPYPLPLTCSALMQLLGVDELREFFKEGLEPIEKPASIHFAQKNSKTSAFEIQIIADKIFYCLNNPLAAVWLHVNGMINIDLWTDPSLKDKCPTIARLVKGLFAAYDPIYSFVHCQVRDFVLEFESVQKGKLQEARQWILQHIGKYSLFQILQGMQYVKKENVLDVPETTFDHPLRCLDSDGIFSYEKYLKHAQLGLQGKFSEHRLTEERARLSIRNQLDELKKTEKTFSCTALCQLILNYGFTWHVGNTTYTIPPMEKK